LRRANTVPTDGRVFIVYTRIKINSGRHSGLNPYAGTIAAQQHSAKRGKSANPSDDRNAFT
jgi:hypothetical protein